MSNIVNELRTRGEYVYRSLMLLFGIVIWFAIIVAILDSFRDPKMAAIVGIYVLYAVLIFLFFIISALVYRATAFGNMIMLGQAQFPQLYAMVLEGSREIGLSEPPKTFLFNSNGLFNAFARRLFGGDSSFLLRLCRSQR